MVEIIPSLLTTNVNDLYFQINRLKPFYTHFQIDIVNKDFAEHATNQLSDIIASHPDLNGITVDFDLMVTDYKKALKEVEEISNFVHVDVVFLHSRTLKNNQLPISQKYTIGIAIDPEEDISQLSQNFKFEDVPQIQIMTVKPGLQGEPFIPEMLNKIDQLRSANYRNKIYIDGAINIETLPQLLYRSQKPDVLCPGSFFSHAENVAERVNELHELLKE